MHSKQQELYVTLQQLALTTMPAFLLTRWLVCTGLVFLVWQLQQPG